MKEAKALQVLRKHNDWRRGGRSRQQDPREIGEAIDVAIAILKDRKLERRQYITDVDEVIGTSQPPKSAARAAGGHPLD